MSKKNILFLCTGNSCRSQMAEGWCRHFWGDRINAFSAGTKKHGLNPRAVLVMKEAGVDISDHQSKTVDDLKHIPFQKVVTVCSDADQNCPVFEGASVIHVGFDDPPRMTEGMAIEEEVLEVYRRVRDEIKVFISEIEKYLN